MAAPPVQIILNKRQQREIKALMKRIPRSLPQVMKVSLNQVGRKFYGTLVKVLRVKTGLKSKYIKNLILKIPATRAKWSEFITISDKRVPAIALKSRANAKGVSYKHPTRGRLFIPGAFIQKMRSGHIGVFLRKTKVGRGKPLGRPIPKHKFYMLMLMGEAEAKGPKGGILPIKEVKPISLPFLYRNLPELSRKIEADAIKNLMRVIRQKIKWQLEKNGL